MRRASVPLGLLIVLVVAACTSGSAPAPSSSRRPGAAEPASAPPVSGSPAGRIGTPGAQPEGIVYDAVTGLVAVAVRDPARLVLLDARSLTVRRTVSLPGVVRHLQLAGPGGPVLVPCEDADRLVVVPLGGGSLQSVAVGRSPHDAAAVAGSYVVGDEFGRSLSVVAGGRLVRTISGNGIQQPGGVVAVGRTAVLVDVGAFTVSTFDPGTGRRAAVAAAGAGPTHGVATGAETFVVADTRGDRLRLFTAAPLRQVADVAVPGAPYGLAYDPVRRWVWTTLTARNEAVAYAVGPAGLAEVARVGTVRQPDTIAVAPGSATLWVAGVSGGQVQRISR